MTLFPAKAKIKLASEDSYSPIILIYHFLIIRFLTVTSVIYIWFRSQHGIIRTLDGYKENKNKLYLVRGSKHAWSSLGRWSLFVDFKENIKECKAEWNVLVSLIPLTYLSWGKSESVFRKKPCLKKKKRDHEKVQSPAQLWIGISGLSDQKALWPFLELQIYMPSFSVFISAFTGSVDARYLTERWQFIHLKQKTWQVQMTLKFTT